MNLAIFDLDNTLIAGDSDHLWGEFLLSKKLVDADHFKKANDDFYADYCRGELDIHAYLRFALQPLTQFSSDERSQLHAEFMQTYIHPIMLDKARALIEKHRQQGDTLLIITATNRFVTEPIATALGIETLLASEGEIQQGRYTGEPSGTPCFAEGKVVRLHAWLKTEKQKLEGAYFYSDSHNDLPLLRLVTHPIAVDPDEKLEAVAKNAHWPIISLR